MGGDFKRTNIAGTYIAPEYAQGTSIWNRTTTGASAAANELIDSAIPGSDADYPPDIFGVYIRSGPLAGEIALVSSYTSAMSKLTLDRNFTANPGSGISYTLLIRVPAKAQVGDDVDIVERDFDTQVLDKLSHLISYANAPVSLESELPGLKVPAGDGVTPLKDAFSFLLDCLGDRRVVPGVLVDTGASTTVIPVKTAVTGTHKALDWVFINGEFRRVASVGSGPDQITLQRALSAIPAEDDVCYGTEVWTPRDEGHKTITVVKIMDDQVIEATGVVLSVKGNWQWSQLPKMTLEGTGEDWTYYDTFALKGILPTNIPAPLLKGECALYVPYGAGSPTILACNMAEFDFGHQVENIRDSEVGNSYRIIDRNSTVGLTFRNKNATIKTSQRNGDIFELHMQGGNVAGNAVMLVSHCMCTQINNEDEAGHKYWKAQMRQVADLELKMQIIRA